MKKLLLVLVLLAALMTGVAAAEGMTLTSGDYVYNLLEDGTAEIVMYVGWAQELAIPAELDGHRVSAIGEFAFMMCGATTRVTIPESVVAMGANPFAYCVALTDIVVSADNPRLSVIDGVLFDREAGRLICYPSGAGAESYTVPDGTVCIGSDAFSNCDALVHITLPDSVTTIEDYAFIYCSALTSINLPDSVVRIGQNPFAACDALTEIRLSLAHPTLKIVEGVLFDVPEKKLICYPGTRRAESYAVPQGVEVIGGAAFFSCRYLLGVTLPEGVTTIGDSAFSYCTSLLGIQLPGSVAAIGEYAFQDCAAILSVTVPRGSWAEQWCGDNGLPFQYAPE